MSRYMVVTADGRAYFYSTYADAMWRYDLVAACHAELYEYEIGEGYIRIA